MDVQYVIASAPELQADPRNSSARVATAGFFGRIAGFIDEHFPGVTPDHITDAGAAVASFAMWEASRAETRKAQIGWTLVGSVGLFADAVDGPLARLRQEKHGIPLSHNGGNRDFLADRGVNTVAPLLMALRAKREGRTTVYGVNLLAALTATWPSFARARAEKYGVIVNESALGSHLPRSILGQVGLGIQELAPITGLYMSVANVTTAAQRIHATRPNSPHAAGQASADVREKAASRHNLAKKVIGATTLIVAGVAVANHRRGNKS